VHVQTVAAVLGHEGSGVVRVGQDEGELLVAQQLLRVSLEEEAAGGLLRVENQLLQPFRNGRAGDAEVLVEERRRGVVVGAEGAVLLDVEVDGGELPRDRPEEEEVGLAAHRPTMASRSSPRTAV